MTWSTNFPSAPGWYWAWSSIEGWGDPKAVFAADVCGEVVVLDGIVRYRARDVQDAYWSPIEGPPALPVVPTTKMRL